jgi:hypothetical protein
VLAGAERDVAPHDRRLDLAIKGDSRNGVLDAGDDEDLVLDVVGVAAQRPARSPYSSSSRTASEVCFDRRAVSRSSR